MWHLTATRGGNKAGATCLTTAFPTRRGWATDDARLRLAPPAPSTGGLPLRSFLRNVPEWARAAPRPLRNHSGGGPPCWGRVAFHHPPSTHPSHAAGSLPLRGVARAKRAQVAASRRRGRRSVAHAVACATRAQSALWALGVEETSTQMRGEHCSPLKLPLRGVATRDRQEAITATLGGSAASVRA